MGNLFSLDSPIVKLLTRIADIWILNFIFIVTSLPVVTIGASVTALHYMSMKMAKGQEGYIIRGYLKSFKQNFKQSTIIYLIMLVIGAILVGDIYFWLNLNNTIGTVMGTLSTVMALVYFIELIYVFALQATFDNPVKRTIKNAFLIALQRFPITLLLGIFIVVIVYFCVEFIVVDAFMLVYGFGLAAMGTAVFYNWAFKKYMEEEGTSECGEQDEEQEGDKQECNNE